MYIYIIEGEIDISIDLSLYIYIYREREKYVDGYIYIYIYRKDEERPQVEESAERHRITKKDPRRRKTPDEERPQVEEGTERHRITKGSLAAGSPDTVTSFLPAGRNTSKGWNSQAHRDFPESSTQATLAGMMLVGRLGLTVRFSRDSSIYLYTYKPITMYTYIPITIYTYYWG